MNSKIKEYLEVLEEECGENKNKATDNKKLYMANKSLYAGINSFQDFRRDYKWRLKDRFKNLWKNFLMRFEYLSKYNPFDFKSYQKEWNPYGFDLYAKISQTSTPLKRFKRFCMELKGLYRGCKEAFFFTPTTIQHFQKNKKRINWFEENVWCWFSKNKKENEKFEDELKTLGYKISKRKDYIYYDPKCLKDL